MSITTKRRTKFFVALSTCFLLYGNAIYGQSIDPSAAASGLDSNFVKWSLTQGGLTIVLIMVLWSYRRDLQRVSEAKEQTITVLMQMVTQNITINTKLTTLVESLSVEIRRLEEKSRRNA